MNFCDQISNQTTIYYSQGRYNRNWSSPSARSPKKPKKGKESTKEWVARTFSSETARPERNSSSALTNANTPTGNSSKDGKPAVFFLKSLVYSINDDKFKFCLVGKFPRWRPGLSQIRDWVSSKWKLEGEWSITLLDHRHVFIRLNNEADMLHVWSRGRWFVRGHPMRVFKWFPTFIPSKGEPSAAAVWVSFPSLPVAFFQQELLFPIASVSGKVLAMDGPTRNLSQTHVARVCLEVDLLKELPRQVWVGFGEEDGFWQDICYHRLPPYCSHCREQGHSIKGCQANRGDLPSGAAKSNYSRESGGKKVRICPIIEDDAGGRQSMILGLSQASLWEDDTVFSSEITENKRKEETTHKGECSNAADENLSADNYSNAVLVSQDTDVSRKLGSPETEPEGEILGAEAPQSEENRESIGKIIKKISPRRQKGLSFLWKSREKDLIPEAVRLSHLKKFKHSEIKRMTNSFQDMIGKEGFSSVFKGKLPDGQEVAVKVRQTSPPEVEEFLKEMQLLSNIDHSNIIRLLGFCWEGSSRILVYEFTPGGSLAEITDSEEQSKGLCEVAVGVARGLEFLHRECDPPVLHLHINPSNILLDKDLRPKITGLGRAHVTSDSDPTAIRGTVGYNPPEFYRPWRISTESDVYSYGITLLEMTLGKGGRNPQWVRRRVIEEGGVKEFAREETQRKMVIVGMWCTQYDPALRPSFTKVIDMLEGSADDLFLPPSSSSAYDKLLRK